MALSNTRYMQYLHGYKIIWLAGILLLFGVSDLAAQKYNSNNFNYQSFKAKQYYFGITLAYNTSNYRVFRSREFLEGSPITSIESVNGPGLNLGLVTNLKIGEYFDIRFLPTLSFATRNLNYTQPSEQFPEVERSFDPVFVEAPLQFRYKSDTYNDMKVFILGGIKYAFDVSSQSRTALEQSLVRIAPSDFALEVGFGFQFYFPYFIFSPELKFSQGLSNAAIYSQSVGQSTVLDKVFSRAFTLSFHFEG